MVVEVSYVQAVSLVASAGMVVWWYGGTVAWWRGGVVVARGGAWWPAPSDQL